MYNLSAAFDHLQPDVLFLLTFLAAIAAGSLPAARRRYWSSRFLDARRNHLFGYPVELCVALVALPLIFLLPRHHDTPTPAAVVLVSVFAGFFAVDYLRCHRFAWNVLYEMKELPCPGCTARRASRVRRIGIVAGEEARRAEGEKEAAP